MNHRVILFIIGAVVVILGAYPLTSNIIFMGYFSKDLPKAGSVFYQMLIVVFGLLAMAYSLKKGKENSLPKKQNR